jgi:AcrR family transcriptional regulator
MSAGKPLSVVREDDPRAREIVEIAYGLLEQDGLEGLTIRAMLQRTGLARRAFYERFGGKDDLVLAVFEYTIRRAADYFADQVGRIADPLDQLQLIVTAIALGSAPFENVESAASLAGAGRRGAAMSREHLRLAEARPRELESALRPLLALIADLLEKGMAAGVVRTTSPATLAMLVYNLVSTTVHAELLAEDDGVADHARRMALANDLWEFCRRAIIP